MEKDWKSCKFGKIGHSEPVQWEKIGKVANRAKLAIPSHSEPLWWEKIGKVANRAKLAIPSHSESFQWEKIGKVANWAKLAILSHFGGKRLQKLQLRQNPTISLGGVGWVHHPEPQCNVDPKFQLNWKNRGFLFSVFHKLEMYVCNEVGGGVGW